ncbi:MAG: FAD-dependent oxidoreductase [Clostridia bacterium]|nr:FAD-dependent oxidoreductase [Clostridia bacterium]
MQDVEMPSFMALHEDITVDAAVIGGGLCGILTAYYLKKAGLKTVVLEAARIGSGQTGNTTAKITSQHGTIYQKLIKEHGEEKARQYADANERAIEEYRKLVSKLNIDCDFTDCSAYLFTLNTPELLEKELEAAKQLGINAYCTTETELPFRVASALCFENQARFHPLKFLSAVAAELDIYENTKVKAVSKDAVETECGNVKAKYVIFCCHYPFINFPGFYFLKLHQERSLVTACRNVPQINGMYLDTDGDGFSFRMHNDILLMGGDGYRTGENPCGGKAADLQEISKKYWPESISVASWSAQDCISIDGVPYIGRFSDSEPNWYVATGFGKWGMTSSMASALMIKNIIVKGKSQWDDIFSPKRFNATSAKGMMKESIQAVRGLGKRFFGVPQLALAQIQEGRGGIIEHNGHKVGVYKNENGEMFAVEPYCTHLGCQLEWNPDEKTWDCPCHGSRFDYEGNLIDNPAQSGLNKKKIDL